MSLKKIGLLINLSLFCILFANAQTISGKIISTEKEAIPYATIQIGETYGVISNDEGEFSINTKGFPKNKTVKISCLGFENLLIPLNKFLSQNYTLKEHVAELSEVYISRKKLTVAQILQKVKENKNDNYSVNTENEIFYRSTTLDTPKKLEFEIVKASELKKKTIKAFNTEFENLRILAENKTSSNYKDILLNYSIFNDSTKIKVQKGTNLINESLDKSTDKLSEKFISIIGKQLDSSATYKVKTGLFKIIDSLEVGSTFSQNKKDTLSSSLSLKNTITNVINKHDITEDSYFSFIFNYEKNNYILEGITSFNEEPVYKITFTPKRKSEKFEGVIYVNTSDFAVVKIDYKLGKNRFGQRVNLKALVGIKFVENKIQGTVLFKKGSNGFYNLQYIKNEKQQYAYFSRPFKFIKNKVDKNDNKTIFKFKFKVETVSNTIQELYVVQNTTNTNETFTAFKNKDNYKLIKIQSYNPELWDNYNIIAPVDAIKNYHLEKK
ncbi:MAG: hypothetical protein ACPG6B_06840 [Oceanihabitans sp.]